MLVLGIDTSTPAGTVGLVNEDGVLAEDMLNIEETHSERLMPAVERMLQLTEKKPIDLCGIAVSLGPGSFTGARIGLTAGKTLAQALEIPIVGLTSLEILAYGLYSFPGLVCPVVDARHHRGYFSLYSLRARTQGRTPLKDEPLQRLWQEEAASFQVIAGRLKEAAEQVALVGNGVYPYQDLWQGLLGQQAVIPPAAFHYPRGGIIADLGRNKLVNGFEDQLWELNPLYLKKPQAEINWEKRQKQIDR
ncbi:MAG: tRNA (adenosine(37)-N6)-threonylcarbamoyltransferase complex dimerization subunit type 1 TsaB [Halanaerobium sp.]|nr:tRNA (adenosine(37)-N6)-threonylcarbamoyltransferase complex dimerization subunit type 1 TsaB [Halanaerobium sp.]